MASDKSPSPLPTVGVPTSAGRRFWLPPPKRKLYPVVWQASRASLLTFFLVTCAVTWTCFISVVAMSGRAGTSALREVVLFIGVFAPSYVALGLTAWADGRTGVVALLRRLVQWDVGARWYVFAAGYMATIKLAVALLHRVAMGAWPRFGHEAWYVMVVAIVFSTPVQAGEEIGWRGYALPRLAGRFGLARGSLVLGVVWACWHLPLFFLPAADKYGQSFPVYLLQVTALSVAAAWLYGHTKGSLLLVMLMHAAVNNTKDIVPSVLPGATHVFGLSASPVAWLTVTLLWIAGAYFLLRMPGPEMSATESSA